MPVLLQLLLASSPRQLPDYDLLLTLPATYLHSLYETETTTTSKTSTTIDLICVRKKKFPLPSALDVFIYFIFGIFIFWYICFSIVLCIFLFCLIYLFSFFVVLFFAAFDLLQIFLGLHTLPSSSSSSFEGSSAGSERVGCD